MTRRSRLRLRSIPADRFEPLESDGDALPAARDRETGATVRVRPRGGRVRWAQAVARESLAREVAALGLPWIVPVLHAGPGIVYADPPPVTPRRPLPRAVAAACTLAACEVLAHLHALGVTTETAELSFGTFNLRVDGERGRIAWLVPGIYVPHEGSLSDEDIEELFSMGADEPIVADLHELARLFFSLCPEPAAEPVAGEAQRAALDALVGLRDGNLSFRAGANVAGLARLLAELAPPERAVTSLPVVDTLPPRRFDYDAVIADGEAELAVGSISSGIDSDEYIAVPLAAAYHQRACRSSAQGELDAALADVQRATELDGFPAYRTTLAAILDALGRGGEARDVVAAALAAWPPPKLWDSPPEGERARAHATRGAFALRDGDLALAESDLRRAFELQPTAAHAHHLGAALYARGDLHGALAAESRSVELEPTSARYRWALAVTLHELGRSEEALAHAREACARDPAYRDRFTRRFGRS